MQNRKVKRGISIIFITKVINVNDCTRFTSNNDKKLNNFKYSAKYLQIVAIWEE